MIIMAGPCTLKSETMVRLPRIYVLGPLKIENKIFWSFKCSPGSVETSRDKEGFGGEGPGAERTMGILVYVR